MARQLSIGTLEKRRDAKLKALAQAGPLIQGSLATIRVTCGNPNCKCARGEKHESHILNRKEQGRSTSLYIPVDMVAEVRKWVLEQRRVKRLMKEISDLGERIVRLHVRTRRAKARNLAAAAEPRWRTRSSRST